MFAREILAGRNWRNLPVVVAVALLALADLLSHLESLRALPTDMMGDRLAIAVVTALVALIGGRITPSFTTNWLKARGSPPPALGRLDGAVMVLTVLALLTWLVWPRARSQPFCCWPRLRCGRPPRPLEGCRDHPRASAPRAPSGLRLAGAGP